MNTVTTQTATSSTSTESTTLNVFDVFTTPGDFFSGLLNTKRHTLYALLTLILVSSGGIYLFHSGMDPEWIVEQQMLHVEVDKASEAEEIKQFLMETAPYAGSLGAIFNGIFTLILVSVLAAYYRLAGGKSTQLTYKDWFSFSVWTQIPGLIYVIGLMGLLFTASTGELPLAMVNYASLNQVLLNLPIGAAFYDVAEAINLFYLWNIYLAAVGLQRWAGLPTIKAFVISAFPYVLVFAGWTLVSL